MFSSRQFEEISPLVEISFVVLTPGAVNNGTTVGASGACKLGNSGSSNPATFALGDQLEVFPSSAAATNGVVISAAPTGTAGTAEFNFQNATGGSVTPTAGAVYTVVATRLVNTLVS